MAENEAYVPQLTLNPGGSAAAAQEFNPKAQEERDQNAVTLDMGQLTPEEQKTVEDFAKQIDITDTTAILTYGSQSQQRIADFSDSALQSTLR